MTEEKFEIENDLTLFDGTLTTSVGTISDYSINEIVFPFENDEDLVISWEDGKLDVKCTEGKMTDAGKAFFDWLKQYIEQNYDLVPKKKK